MVFLVFLENLLRGIFSAGEGSKRGKGHARKGKEERANGGCLGYPEAKKDVVSCEKARGSANRN